MATEVGVLKKLTEDPERPYAVVLGGSKVSDKLGVIATCSSKADRLLIGGGMAFTFLKAQGYAVGSSLLEEDQVDTVALPRDGCRERASRSSCRSTSSPPTRSRADAPRPSPRTSIPAGRRASTSAPRPRKLFASKLADAETVVWNGPMGVFESAPFAEGTKAVAQGHRPTSAAFTIVGGGDSAAAVRLLGFDEAAFGHISTGGGASLELLEGKELPGLAALED